MKPNPAGHVGNPETSLRRQRYTGSKNVAGYRLYGLDGVNKVASAEWFDADCDDTAIEVAKQKMDGHGGELWQGRRLIARLPRNR